YYVGVFNPNGIEQTVRLSWSFILDPFGIPLNRFTFTGSLPILDDATVTNTICLTNLQKIVTASVGVVLRHDRVSDEVLTLITPAGRRIVLFENRGGPNASNLGSGTTVTNVFPQTSAGNAIADTNVLQTGATAGTLIIDYDFFPV